MAQSGTFGPDSYRTVNIGDLGLLVAYIWKPAGGAACWKTNIRS